MIDDEEAGNRGVNSGSQADDDDPEVGSGVADEGFQAGDKLSKPAEPEEGIGVLHPDGESLEEDGVGDGSGISAKFAE